MKATVGGKTLVLQLGDITQQTTDAIANAANSRLAGGGGVDGAIHRAAGPSLTLECTRIGRCPTGSAVATHGGNLKARYVFHAVGPIWKGGGQEEATQLADAYQNCCDLAERKGCLSLAFPSISTGVYGYPVDQAARIALSQVADHLAGDGKLEHVVFVLFDDGTYQSYGEALKQLSRARSDMELEA